MTPRGRLSCFSHGGTITVNRARRRIAAGFALCAVGGSLAACIARQQPAQLADGGRFYMLIGSDTVLAERYTRSADRIAGEYVDRVRGTRVSYEAALAPDGRVIRLAATRATPGVASVRTILTFAGDSAMLDENRRIRYVRGAAGAQALAGGALALTEQLLIRARRMEGDSARLPILDFSGRRVDTVTVRWTGADSAVASSTGNAALTWFHVSPSGLLLGARLGSPPATRIVRSR